MKYTKSAIGLLTREYRAVLKKCLLINLGLFALGAIATPAEAGDYGAILWDEYKEYPGYIGNGVDLATISEYSEGTITADQIGVYGYGVQTNSYTADEINITAPASIWMTDGGTFNVNGDNTSEININGTSMGIEADYGAQANIGNANADINILGDWAVAAYEKTNAENVGTSGAKVSIIGKTIDITANGTADEANNKYVYGVIALNQSHAQYAPSVDITGETVNITAENGSAAVHAGNGSENATTEVSTVNITAEKIKLKSTTGNAINAMSQGKINIVGNLEAEGVDAIVTRGNAETNINMGHDEYKTVLNGDINFNAGGTGNGQKANATVNVNLNGSASEWNGNVKSSWNSANATMDVTDGVSLSLKNGAKWNVSKINETGEKGVSTTGALYQALNNLNVDGGNVKFNETGAQVQVDNLKVGSNGVNITKYDDTDTMTVNKSADFRNGVADNHTADITVADNASIYVDADADGNLMDDVAGNKANINLDGIQLAKVMNEGAVVQTGGYKTTNGKAANTLKAYYQTVTTNGNGNFVLGAKQGYTDLIGILQNGNYIKAYDAADADNTSVAANLKALDDQVFANAGNITDNATAIAANADAIATNATAIAGKQDTITDLATIRSGAAAGATALQASALTPYSTTEQANALYAAKSIETTVDSHTTLINTNKTAISTINSGAVMNSGITSDKVAQYDGYATSKQDTITDLATIRSGAAAGATALQASALDAYSTTEQANALYAAKSIETTVGNHATLISAHGEAITGLQGNIETINGNITSLNTSIGQKANADIIGTGFSSTNTVKAAIEAKQDTLVSGTNIKTINGNTLLGSGDITIDTDTAYTASNVGVTVDATNHTIGAKLAENSGLTLYEDADNPSKSGLKVSGVAKAHLADALVSEIEGKADAFTLGGGLAFGTGDDARKISVQTGNGLMIDTDGKVAINKVAEGSGLDYDDNGAVKVAGLTNDHIAANANIALSKLATTDLSQFNNTTSDFQSGTEVATAISDSILKASASDNIYKDVMTSTTYDNQAVSAGALKQIAYQVGTNMKADQLGWNINVDPSQNDSFSKSLTSTLYSGLEGTNRTVIGALNTAGEAILENADNIATKYNYASLVKGAEEAAPTASTAVYTKVATDEAIASTANTIRTEAGAAWTKAETWMNTALGIDSKTKDADEALQAALTAAATADETTNNIAATSFAGALHELDVEKLAKSSAKDGATLELENADGYFTAIGESTGYHNQLTVNSDDDGIVLTATDNTAGTGTTSTLEVKADGVFYYNGTEPSELDEVATLATAADGEFDADSEYENGTIGAAIKSKADAAELANYAKLNGNTNENFDAKIFTASKAVVTPRLKLDGKNLTKVILGKITADKADAEAIATTAAVYATIGDLSDESGATLTVKDYVDAGDAAALASAKDYTNGFLESDGEEGYKSVVDSVKGHAAEGAFDADGEYDDDTIGAAIQSKADAAALEDYAKLNDPNQTITAKSYKAGDWKISQASTGSLLFGNKNAINAVVFDKDLAAENYKFGTSTFQSKASIVTDGNFRANGKLTLGYGTTDQAVLTGAKIKGYDNAVDFLGVDVTKDAAVAFEDAFKDNQNIWVGNGEQEHPTSFAGALRNIDSALGKIHGLANEDGTVNNADSIAGKGDYADYHTHLKVGTGVDDLVVSLDNAIIQIEAGDIEAGKAKLAVADQNGKIIDETYAALGENVEFGDVKAASLNFGGNNTANAITTKAITSKNKKASTLATAAAVYATIADYKVKNANENEFIIDENGVLSVNAIDFSKITVADGSITRKMIADGAIGMKKLAPKVQELIKGAAQSDDLADVAFTGEFEDLNVENGAIKNRMIADGAIGMKKLTQNVQDKINGAVQADGDNVFTGENTFTEETAFTGGIKFSTAEDADVLSKIDNGASSINAGDAQTIATTATVLKSAQNAEFTASDADSLKNADGEKPETIKDAINTLASNVDDIDDKVGDADFSDTYNIEAETDDLTSAIIQLDEKMGDVSKFGTTDYEGTNAKGQTDLVSAIEAVDKAVGDISSITADYAKNTDGTGSTDLATAINNVANNAQQAIENAVSEVEAQIHGDGTDGSEVTIGNKADKTTIGKVNEDTGLTGIEVNTKEKSVDLAVNSNGKGTEIKMDDDSVAMTATNGTGATAKTAGIEISNQGTSQSVELGTNMGDGNEIGMKITNNGANGQSITMGVPSVDTNDEEQLFGMQISNDPEDGRVIDLGASDGYALEIDVDNNKATIGDGTDEVVIGKGTILADKSVMVGDPAGQVTAMYDTGIVAKKDDNNQSTLGSEGLWAKKGSKEAGVSGEGLWATDGDKKANVSNTGLWVENGASNASVGSTGFFVTNGTDSSSMGPSGIYTSKDVTAKGYVTGKDVVAKESFTLAEKTVHAIDTDGSNVSKEQDVRKDTLATVETVYAGAENAHFTADDATGVTKDSDTLHEAIMALDSAVGTMELSTGNKTFLDESGDPITNATEALNALDGVVGNIVELEGAVEGNLADKGSDIATHLAAIDARLGGIKALKTTDYSNLADENSSVDEHFMSLDSAIGNRTTDYKNNLNGEGKSNGYVAEGSANKDIVTMISEVASNIGTAEDFRSTNHISSEATVNANLSALDSAIGTMTFDDDIAGGDLTSTINNLNSKVNESNRVFSEAISKLDHNYRTLRHDFEAGMAGQAALSALVPNAKANGNTQLAIGTGAYKGHTAAAIGGFHWFTENLLFNAGVAWDNNEATGRMGITYSW